MIHARETDTVGDLVATDFRSAAVFEKAGIDFCCGGRRSLREACQAAGVSFEDVTRSLASLPPLEGEGQSDPRAWAPGPLVDRILTRHHTYVREALPTIANYLSRLVSVHGSRHPELAEVASTFEQVRAGMQQHMMKEERVLFPYILELEATANAGRPLPPSPFGTVENPIRMMEREHEDAGDEMRRIRELTGGYVPPADGCTTYRVALAELARFERDLHEHVHLENNVLFPKAVALEAQLQRRI